MAIDLMLDLGDDLLAGYEHEALRQGTTVEELIRQALYLSVGKRCITIDAEGAPSKRPTLYFDLRST